MCTVLAAALLASCGFQLQGSAGLPAAAAAPYLDAPDPYSDFYQALSAALVRSGALLETDRGAASAVLIVRRDETGQNVLSVSARNVPTEYEVFYTVSYEIRRGEEVLIPLQTVTLTQDYVYDVTDVLAKSLEEEHLREALAKDIAQMIIRRLSSL
ncbi:MAG TPA: LPS assembly lipoprotein LptE [Gammaproteobacteria bacterium]|nr:LPS assembly lipoprotein LptE [Gammaproteobacteria bacterium]